MTVLGICKSMYIAIPSCSNEKARKAVVREMKRKIEQSGAAVAPMLMSRINTL